MIDPFVAAAIALLKFGILILPYVAEFLVSQSG
ncbi:hypothetical protein NONI108955_20885 [Nocardia ninae]